MSNRKNRFTYDAIAVQQQPGAPEMYLLGVAADELLKWADVPSKRADYMAGYQRSISTERAKSITAFLNQSPRNIIPGAIIVTLNSERARMESKGGSRISIEVDATEIPFTESLNQVFNQFTGRLSPAELESLRLADNPAGLEADLQEDLDESDEDTAGIPESYLAVLTAELKVAIENFDSLPEKRRGAIERFVKAVSKPGMIIDGQHRVFGAKGVAKNSIILPVVLLPGLEFSEQVFHFYVLNNKAKPLSAPELRNTISTSLTNAEIDNLWKRFEDAGVDPQAARWTYKVNNDPRSPFLGLVDFGLRTDDSMTAHNGFLKENVTYQLVSKFVKMNKKYKILYKGIEAFDNETDERLDYFYVFWSAIKLRYEELWNTSVAAGGGQLFMKASMLVLQEYVLDRLAQYTSVEAQISGAPSPLKDFEDLEKAIKGVLTFLPPEFFSTEWQQKQVDTTEGHRFLRAQIELAVQNQGRFLGNQQLFKKAKT